MNLALGLRVGMREIAAHKARSLLTMLGVILGVASLVCMFAITKGEAVRQLETLRLVGGIERVGIEEKDPSEAVRHMAEISPGRTMADVAAIERGAPLVSHVAPEVRTYATLVAGGNIYGGRLSGTTPSQFYINDHNVAAGRFLTDLDVARVTPAIVIGQSAAAELFPGELPEAVVGRRLTVNGRPFVVVGVLHFYERESDRLRREAGISSANEKRREERGMTGRNRRYDPLHWKNNALMIPITRFLMEFRTANVDANKNDSGPNFKLDDINFEVASFEKFEAALHQVSTVLERTHRGIDDYGFNTREDWFDAIETSIRATRVTGGAIAGISLLVGGIGITNIMLASISQRIREIGIRMAVGARRRDIFAQILVESLLIGVAGGILGLLTAGVFVWALQTVSPTEVSPIVEGGAVALGFAFSVLTGVLSGLYPAWHASRLHPIEALRYD